MLKARVAVSSPPSNAARPAPSRDAHQELPGCAGSDVSFVDVAAGSCVRGAGGPSFVVHPVVGTSGLDLFHCSDASCLDCVKRPLVAGVCAESDAATTGAGSLRASCALPCLPVPASATRSASPSASTSALASASASATGSASSSASATGSASASATPSASATSAASTSASPSASASASAVVVPPLLLSIFSATAAPYPSKPSPTLLGGWKEAPLFVFPSPPPPFGPLPRRHWQ